MTKFYKRGYPKLQFVRDSFSSLNGEWNFRFDSQKINVPFSYENEVGGIGKKEPWGYGKA